MKARPWSAFALAVVLQAAAGGVRAEPGEVVLGSVYTLDSQSPGSLYLSLGTEGDHMEEGMQRFVQALGANAGPDLEWWYAPFPEESHATILHRSLYRGLELFHGDEYPGL